MPACVSQVARIRTCPAAVWQMAGSHGHKHKVLHEDCWKTAGWHQFSLLSVMHMVWKLSGPSPAVAPATPPPSVQVTAFDYHLHTSGRSLQGQQSCYIMSNGPTAYGASL